MRRSRVKLTKVLLLTITLFFSNAVWSQCAPGIPGAGNPGCIPPTASGSPYAQPGDPNLASPNAGPAAAWEDRWGAIAIDYQNGAAGGADKGRSEDEAIQLAMQRCEHSGGTRCEVTVSFVNQCAAIVQKTGGGLVYPATAADTNEATARAFRKCGNGEACKVKATLCTYAVRVQ